MKKALIAIVGLVVLIIILIVLLGRGSDTEPTINSTTTPSSAVTVPTSGSNSDSGTSTLREEDRHVSERTGDASEVPDAEALLGISLPDDAGITTVLNNDLAVGVVGRTGLSVEESKTFFAAEMSGAGYSQARPWGLSPLDSETLQSASFRGNGENWSINLRAEGGMTTFDIQRQF